MGPHEGHGGQRRAASEEGHGEDERGGVLCSSVGHGAEGDDVQGVENLMCVSVM